MSTFEERIQQKADRYMDGLQKAGLQPNDRLTRAMAERAYREAREEHAKENDERFVRNVNTIIREHRRDMNEIKRSGARLRLWTCPLVALMFGLVSWHNFNQVAAHPEAWYLGVIFACGAALFLIMLVGGAIFDRPEPEE